MDISNTIQDLIDESRRPKKSRVQDVSQLVNTICDHAYQSGLQNKDLGSIIELIREPSTLDQTSITTLIKSLYPAERVSSRLVSLIVAALGPSEKKPSAATQNLLLWWLSVVRTAFEEWNVLEKLYSILFNLLDMLTIRSQLCRILCLITRRKHVKPWRIHRLHELSQNASGDQGLNALLKVYQNFYPDVIVPQGKSMEIFKGLDKEWIGRLNAIQEQNEFNANSISTFEVIGDGNKRRKTETIPRLQTRQILENSVVLEELRTIEDLGNKYERIEYPNQIISALDNRQLQRLIVLRDDKILTQRLNSWLAMFFDAHLQHDSEGDNDKVLSEVLEQLLIFCRQTMTIPEAFLSFLPQYLEHWKGTANKETILGILTYLEIKPFQEHRAAFLEQLEQVLLDTSEDAMLEIISLYHRLLQSWVSRLSQPDSESTESDSSMFEAILSLTSHCSTLALQILTGNPSPSAQAVLQNYFHLLAYSSSQALEYQHLRISILAPPEIYLAIFVSPTIFTLSALSDVLCIYKDTLEQYLPGQRGSKAAMQFARSSIGDFNGYIMDICNLLWRSRAFNTTDNNAAGCLLPPDTFKDLQRFVEAIPIDRRYTLTTVFSVSFHPALSAISIQALRDMEDRVIAENLETDDNITERHAGPVTQRSLVQLTSQGGIELSWLDYRTEVLDVLASMGADGLSELISRSIKTK